MSWTSAVEAIVQWLEQATSHHSTTSKGLEPTVLHLLDAYLQAQWTVYMLPHLLANLGTLHLRFVNILVQD